jgi:hypothetical protein
MHPSSMPPGPDVESPVDGTLEAATPVRVRERTGDHVRVVTEDGREDYVPARTVEATGGRGEA